MIINDRPCDLCGGPLCAKQGRWLSQEDLQSAVRDLTATLETMGVICADRDPPTGFSVEVIYHGTRDPDLDQQIALAAGREPFDGGEGEGIRDQEWLCKDRKEAFVIVRNIIGAMQKWHRDRNDIRTLRLVMAGGCRLQLVLEDGDTEPEDTSLPDSPGRRGAVVITGRETQTCEVEMVTGVCCNGCGLPLERGGGNPPGPVPADKIRSHFYGMVEASVDGGYDSTHLLDLSAYSFSLCEACLVRIMDSFKLPPRVWCRMDSEEVSWSEDRQRWQENQALRGKPCETLAIDSSSPDGQK